ncbi:MAG: solute carrier family 26 protein [Gemmatimonadota bacterium]|nr:solute carrier family 26 protein [Gemmatimonadota bacterium]
MARIEGGDEADGRGRRLRVVPLARSLAGHDREAFVSDLTAGATVGVMLIPQGMAYAMIAGLPPVYGLYAALVPLAIYALMGTSRQLAVGPVAMVALLVADGVAPLAAGQADRYLMLAVLLSALVGAIQLGMGLLRAGFLVNLLSHPVLAGFTAAAAIIIGTSQLGGLTGLDISKGPVHQMLAAAVGEWGSLEASTLTVGLGAILAGLALKRWAPKLPGPMIVVAVGTLASWAFSLSRHGVQVVGEVPSGLPMPTVPGLWGAAGNAGLAPGDFTALLPVALAIALVGFMESIAVAKVYASRYRYDIDPDQELKALGLANIGGAFAQAFPVTGGFSRTAVNAQAGARSQLSSLVSAGVIAVTLLFLTPLFYHLPNAILAAIIVVAVAGLVDVKGAKALWRVDRRDFALMVATFTATLLLGIEEGILVGAALSVTVLLQQIAQPHVARLGRLPGTDHFRNLARHSDARVEEGMAILRVDASLFYGNAEAFRDEARHAFADTETVDPSGTQRTLILDAYPVNRTDSTGLHMLHALLDEIHGAGGRVFLSGVKGPLHDKLLVGGIVDRIGPEHFFPDVASAVEAASGRERVGPPTSASAAM